MEIIKINVSDSNVVVKNSESAHDVRRTCPD